MRKGKKRRGGAKPSLAKRADRHVLYERSVQNAEAELEFIETTFMKLRARAPRVLREDFCGTANVCCAWTKRHRRNVAYGVDLDPAVLEWARRHKLSKLKPHEAERVHLIQGNVLSARCPPVDFVMALNFSYWVFKDRKLMKRYFRHVHSVLAKDGVLFLDAFGGWEASREIEEATVYRSHTYVWDQARFNPLTSDILCHIHFRFPDRSRIRKAFTYDWRLWTLPELNELLAESGFKPTVYFEGRDKDGEGNGVYTPTDRPDADASWIAYVVAEKR